MDRPVLVTTEFGGVFFGYLINKKNATVTLQRARNVLYWSEDVKGFLGLAKNGPSKTCRVGPEADVELTKVTCIAEVTEKAVKNWEKAPWSE